VHPVSSLMLWLLLLIVVQFLSGLHLLAIALCLFLVCGRSVLPEWRRLVWSARWLLLSLFCILAWGSVGQPVWEGALAPSREGLVSALNHLGRLLVMLLLVAIVRQRMSVRDLLSAAYRLLAPLRRFGVDTTPGIVRLLLVMRQLETLPRLRDWRLLFDVGPAGPAEVFEIDNIAFSWRDYLVLPTVAGGLVAVFLLQV